MTSIANSEAGSSVRAKLNALLVSVREVLATDRSYYVDFDAGSDTTGDGSVGSPWKQPQKAADYISQNIDFSGHRITVNIADSVSAYGGVMLGLLFNSSSTPAVLYFLGNVATPGNVKIGNATSYLGVAVGSFWAIMPSVGTVYPFVNGVRTQPTAGPSYLADPIQCGLVMWCVGNPDALDGNIEIGNVGALFPIFAGNFTDTQLDGGLISCAMLASSWTNNPASFASMIAHAQMKFINGVYTITGVATVTNALVAMTEGSNSYCGLWTDSFVGTLVGKKYLIDELTMGGSFLQILGGGNAENLIGSLPGQLLSGRIKDSTGYRVAGHARVSTQFDKTDNTLADVTGLSADVKTGRKYAFRAELYTTSDVAAGVKAAISGTCGVSAIIYEAIVLNAAAIAAQSRATAKGTAVGGATAVAAAKISITGTFTCNGTGTLTVQFAQNATNAAASSVLVGSTLIVEPAP